MKLKPCPFCAKIPEIVEWSENHFSIACKCGAESPRDSKSKNGAIRIWNRRRLENIKNSQ